MSTIAAGPSATTSGEAATLLAARARTGYKRCTVAALLPQLAWRAADCCRAPLLYHGVAVGGRLARVQRAAERCCSAGMWCARCARCFKLHSCRRHGLLHETNL